MMALSAADWLSVVRREYLQDFIPAGGAAVKFVVGVAIGSIALVSEALHASVEIDEQIPAEHYKAVAEVIGYVMKLRRAFGRART